jgi:hypothetical protein
VDAPADAHEAAASDDDDALPAVGKVWDASGPSLSEMLKQRRASAPEAAPEDVQRSAPPAATSPEPSNVVAADLADLPSVWQKLLDALAERGPMFQSLLINGQLTGIADGQATIRYHRRHESFIKLLERNGKKDAVRDALTQVTGEAVGVRFEIEDSEPATAAATTPAAAAATTATQPKTLAAAALKPAQQPAPASAPRTAVRREAPRAEAPAPLPQAPAAPVVKITPELIDSLKSREPLIKALIDDFGAAVVKVEPPEAVPTQD